MASWRHGTAQVGGLSGTSRADGIRPLPCETSHAPNSLDLGFVCAMMAGGARHYFCVAIVRAAGDSSKDNTQPSTGAPPYIF